jgi:hypothetical protein
MEWLPINAPQREGLHDGSNEGCVMLADWFIARGERLPVRMLPRSSWSRHS